MIEHVDKTNGKKALRLTSGERYKVAAASRRGGRGLSGDLVLLDELREHQNWQAWGAVTKTTMARPMSQVWAASNAGDLSSVVLRHLRSIAHRALGWPDGKDGMAELPPESVEADDSLGIFEWSAAPDREVWDRDGWCEANPSLGHTIDERSIAGAASTRPRVGVPYRGAVPVREHGWARTVPCWVVGGVARRERTDRAERGVIRDVERPACYGVDMSHDRTMVYVAIAYWDTEGVPRVEIAAQRSGPDWLIPWLTSPHRKVEPDHVALQRRGAPISSMWDAMVDVGLDPHAWEGSQLAGWHGAFFDLLRSAVVDHDPVVRLTHGGQPALDVPANSATVKALGDGWVVDRKQSPSDPSALVAAIAAVGLLMTNPEPDFTCRRTRTAACSVLE